METSAAAAQCHYQAGRFSQAAAELEKCDEMWTKRCHKLIHDDVQQHQQNNEESNDIIGDDIIVADDPIVKPKEQMQKRYNAPRMELIALPPLARCADISMCRFRSAISSGVGDKHCTAPISTHGSKQVDDNPSSSKEEGNINLSNIWNKALESNINYRQALKGAAMSLVNTCNNMELHKSSQPQTIQHTNTCKSIQKAVKSTSMAILMAGISASHLYLHHTQLLPSQSNCNSMSKKENAWSVLVDAAILAADLMRTRKEWLDKLNDIHDAQPIMDVRGIKLSILEECICILNETLCTNKNNTSTFNGKNNNDKYQAEDERGNIAMHSFTSALKVAALATGKLILPKLSKSSSEENDQPSKRQRIKKEDKPNLKRDAWNTKYTHFSPLLHSRDRLVDALSFHSAASKYPQRRETFVDKREVCFDEAVMWENRAGALYDTDHESGETDAGCAGYVWKIRNCLRGMEVARSVSSHLDEQKEKAMLQSLEMLASSSSSQFACDLLGCIYAQKGEYSRALETFQMSLDRGGKNESNNSDEEIGKCLVERRTLVNTALCFLSMGEVDTPLELLLHLWLTVSESQPHCAVKDVQPMAILLTSTSNEMEGLIDQSTEHSGQTTKLQLLWKLFMSSSLAQDWSTCLNSAEEMLAVKGCYENRVKTCTDLARVFALLQCRRSVAAQETTRLLLPKLITSGNKPKRESVSAKLLQVLAELYHADALLLNEATNNNHREGETPFDCTQRAVDALESICLDDNANFKHGNALLEELHVTTYNNRGITLLMKGDSVGALHCFREAAKHSSTSASPLPWLILPTYFNLSLLLLRDGHMEESTKSWLRTRDYFATWKDAMRGDNDALRQLKNLRVMAINRHGLLMAKRSMQGGSATMWDQENILEWTPPVSEEGNDVNADSNRVVGVDASQITALDVVLFRFSLSTAEKNSSSSFRRSAGHMGY